MEHAEKHIIKVLLVDNSAVVRQTLREILLSDSDFEIMGITSDPYGAARRMGDTVPDVIILDTDTQRMDGLTFLRRLMLQYPIPVIISITQDDHADEKERNAYAAGAVDILKKCQSNIAEDLMQRAEEIRHTIKKAAALKAEALAEKLRILQLHTDLRDKLSADVLLPPRSKNSQPVEQTEPVICLGASTGGTEALSMVLRMLPATAPGIIIVQHMPPKFTASFAKRLNELCAMEVREAAEGDYVHSGLALIAPGGQHMLLERRNHQYSVSVRKGPPVSRHRPSVDVLFRSAARAAGSNAIGVLMTGMGDDGAQGLLELKEVGALTIAQNESSSIVFGMPKEAISRGAAIKIVPLDQIAKEILQATH